MVARPFLPAFLDALFMRRRMVSHLSASSKKAGNKGQLRKAHVLTAKPPFIGIVRPVT